MKTWDEYSLKHVWPLVKQDKIIRRFLPADEMDEGRYPDRHFFWAIAFTILPNWATMYTKKVWMQREYKDDTNLNKRKLITISRRWVERLQKFDYQSKSK